MKEELHELAALVLKYFEEKHEYERRPYDERRAASEATGHKLWSLANLIVNPPESQEPSLFG